MADTGVDSAAIEEHGQRARADEHPAVAGERKSHASKSMHDGIAVWCDCCSCEAEPYWVAIAEEMGVDLGSDYEAADNPLSNTA
jgi:hypothetical protein